MDEEEDGRTLADALDDAVAQLRTAAEAATSAHLEYTRLTTTDRSWRRLDATVADGIRQRRADVALYAVTQLAEALAAEADDARQRFAGLDIAGEKLPPTPPGDDPDEVRDWWAALDEDDRELMRLRSTAWVGRADGLPLRERHEANLRLLDAEIERRSDLLHPETGEVRDAVDEEEARDLRGLLRLRQVLTGDEDDGLGTPKRERFLYLLDARRYPLKTAVVLGDLDDATHVVIQVPGATTTVDYRLLRELTWTTTLRSEMTRLLPDEARVAVVDWIGYHAPYDIAVRRSLGDSGIPLFVPGEAADERHAREAAPHLARTLAGLRALRPDARIVASGHSYGASALGLALKECPQMHVVDAVMVAGCPGLFATSLDELGLVPGELYVAATAGDVVAFLGMFGCDPARIPGAVRLSPFARRVTYPDGRWAFLRPVIGHESYYNPGTALLHQLAAVGAGDLSRAKHQRWILDPTLAPAAEAAAAEAAVDVDESAAEGAAPADQSSAEESPEAADEVRAGRS